ncbi:MAG: nicotinate (nicotinamide) nucleotide adenylyltransferase [Clostridia bacterium]
MITTAVLGGAFDPVHIEHIKIARACVEELGINRLVLVPTSNPPHKLNSRAPFFDRVKMLKIAFSDFPVDVVISEIENATDDVSYTVDLLPKLKNEFGYFYYIIGGDSLLDFDTWYKPEQIVKMAQVVVFDREGYDGVSFKINELNLKWNCEIRHMKYCGDGIASDEIRTLLDLKLPVSGLSKGVYEYIIKNSLYNTFDDIYYKLPSYLSKARLTHSLNTTRCAIDVNKRCQLKLPYEKVFLSAILHDVGKKYDYDDLKCLGFNVPLNAISTPVQHQYVGAELALTEFNVQDVDVLSAIRCHTTGKPNMTILEKLIYIADIISSERTFPEVNNLRLAVYKNFEQGFKQCLMYSYEYLLTKKTNIYPLTKQAVDFYKENL